MKKQSILLINPPFTQLNTPYPATAYIKGFLNTIEQPSEQIDLGIETILQLFSKEGLERLFSEVELTNLESDNSKRIYGLRREYINTISAVISFLQDKDPTLAYLISERNFLPEASKFEQLEDLEWAFGTMGVRDQGRHIATLYLEDLSDFVVETVDPHFGFSRYAERLVLSASSFDELYVELNSARSYITKLMLDILEEYLKDKSPELVCLSVPFPGNLYAALACGAWLKEHFPETKVAMGGGYPNTELRSLKDPRVFEFVDFICLDDGEAPLTNLLEYLKNTEDDSILKRTYRLVDGEVVYCNANTTPDIKQQHVGTPDYSGLPLKSYLSVIQLTNPMHRLWSDGRWNKLTMAHGCYWGKCTFCDISLDYIRLYEGNSAVTLVDRMEELIAQTGERGFHFVDEAAPPALMKAVALEILKRGLVVSWWTNIRFEKSFTADLCRLLAASGCIAVSGGLEVASDRLLELIAKGVTIEQVTQVNRNFNEAGIMVHAYLMYGFPTQTDQETIDSLEVVRQMFEEGVLQSAFWHRFAMTAHSPVGMNPDGFNVENLTKELGTFANNDLLHSDPTGADHDLYGEGLKASLYNYMHGVCLDWPLHKWFEHKTPRPSIPSDLIASHLAQPEFREMKPSYNLVWIGGAVQYDSTQNQLLVFGKKSTEYISVSSEYGKWLGDTLTSLDASGGKSMSYARFKEKFEDELEEEFLLFWYGAEMDEIRRAGLLVL